MNFTYRMTVNTTSTKGALGCKTIQLGMLGSHVQCSPGCILFVHLTALHSTWIFASLVNAPRFSHSISKRLVLTPQMDSGELHCPYSRPYSACQPQSTEFPGHQKHKALRDILGELSKCSPSREIRGCGVMLEEEADACVRHRGDRFPSWGAHQLRHEWIKALERSRLPMPAEVSEDNSLCFALADTAVKELLSIISCLSSSLLLHYPF